MTSKTFTNIVAGLALLLGGYVVDKFVKPDNSYISLTLDDGSGKMNIKAWKEDTPLLNYSIGELLLIVGRIKDYNNQLYVIPEVVSKLENPLWAKFRTLELKKNYGEPRLAAQTTTSAQEPSREEETMHIVEEKVTNELPANKRQKLIDLIEQLDTNNGADQPLVILHSGIGKEEAQKILENLLSEGEIFEIHPGKLRTTL